MDQASGRTTPSLTFGELARLFVDRQDVKFWETEGPRHNSLYWVRAMLSEQAEPTPRIDRPVAQPQSEADYLCFAHARREAYGFLARAFEYPTDAFLADITIPGYVEALAASFHQLANNDDVNEGLTLWSQVAVSGGALIGEYGLSPLRTAYTRLIYDTNLPFVPPYESVYCNERRVMGKPAGAVADDYRAAGLGIEGAEMPDHIALECEFVALLAGREADAWQAGQREEARQILGTTNRFLSEHVLSWGGKFCADLLALAQVDFYRAVARLGAGLFNDELLRLET
jgi:TorA maturation chaperone TorD